MKSLPIPSQRTGANATPVDLYASRQHNSEQKRLETKTTHSLQAKLAHSSRSYTLEPGKRYLSCRLVHLKAFVDFVNPKEDEFVYATLSFLKHRYATGAHPAQTEVIFNDEEGSMLFDFSEIEGAKFDPAMLLKLNQQIHLTICKQKKNQKAVVLGSKNLDWRAVLHSSSIEVNAEVLPSDLTKQGSLGVAQLHIDLLPPLSKSEALTEDSVDKQITLERKFETEAL